MEREGLHLEHLDLGSGLLESGLSCTQIARVSAILPQRCWRSSCTAHLDGLGELTDVTVATMREEEIGREIAGVSAIRAALQKQEVAGGRLTSSSR
jgi:hypothetical protein